MKIREVAAKDLCGIHDLSKQLGYDYDLEKMSVKLNDIIYNPDHKVYIALENEKIIGYIHVEIYRVLYADNMLNILGVVVDPFYRSQGVGRSLIRIIERYAKELGCCGIRANSGIKRENAHQFYQRRGFVRESDQKRFFRSVYET